MSEHYDALALFSGGLDSILAARVVMDQGLKVLGIHYVTPFFGKPHLIGFWKEHYGVDVVAVDISEDYCRMVENEPPNGYGKYLNPCIDCKVMMMGKTRQLMEQYGARFIISGEVLGQRPMSQRRDALNIITRDGEVRDVLLRPLCARRLDSTPMEESGLVDRERLLDLWGRGRKGQMALAKEYGFTEIPTPAGGCALTESDSAAQFFNVIRYIPDPTPEDYLLCKAGRQYWAGDKWLVIGRNKAGNERIKNLARETDVAFKVKDYPGPVAIGRPTRESWDEETLRDAAAFVASYSGKAVRTAEPVEVLVQQGRVILSFTVMPERKTELGWSEPECEDMKQWKQEKGLQAGGER